MCCCVLLTLQIFLWEQNLEQFHMDLFRFRCYLASLQGGELPNPKRLLAFASRPTKLAMGRLGIFSVSSFHALVNITLMYLHFTFTSFCILAGAFTNVTWNQWIFEAPGMTCSGILSCSCCRTLTCNLSVAGWSLNTMLSLYIDALWIVSRAQYCKYTLASLSTPCDSPGRAIDSRN